jgi:hypothetical protein
MLHLTLEALARLVDEAPEAHEEAHLADCAACRGELDALRGQTEALSTLPKLMPPPNAWPALSERLRAEGLVHAGRRSRPGPGLMRAAAAIALFLLGGTAGFLARGPVERGAQPLASVLETGPVTPPGAGAVGGESAVELSQEVERTEELFASALDRFMQASDTRAPDPAARLAALDNIVLTTAEALNESPADPVINSYHLTAVAQRKALLRQLSDSPDPVF